MSAIPTVVVEPVFVEAGDNFRVTPDTTDRIQPARAAPLDGGGYVLAWVQGGGNGPDERVYAQVFAADDTPLGAAFAVAPGQDFWQQSPSVARLADGGFVIGWSALDGGVANGLFAQRYDSAGDPVGAAITVGTLASSAPFPTHSMDFAALADGGFLATWNNWDGTGSGEVIARLYDADGDPLGAAFQVNTYSTDYQGSPDAAVLADGSFVVMWSSGGQDGDGSGIYGQRFSAAGAATGSEFRVNTVTAGNQTTPQVAALEGGGFVVTWVQPDIFSPTVVKAQVYDSAGATVGGEIAVDSFNSPGPNPNPIVAGLPDGGFAIAWYKDFDNIRAQRYEADGTIRGATFDVSAHTPDTSYYDSTEAMIVTDDGELMVFWHSAQNPNANDSDILAQTYELRNRATEQVSALVSNRIVVDDDGAGSNVVTVTLSVDHGHLTVATGGSEVGASGNGSASVVLTGTVDQLNALLTGGAGSPISYLADTDAPPAEATLTVEVRDGEDQTGTSTAAITIFAVDDPAVAVADAATTTEAAIKNGNVLADNGSGADYDVDGPALSVAAVNGSVANVGTTVTLASGALLTVQADGTYAYDPNGQFDALPAAGSGASNLTALDSFTYTLTGGGAATVTMTITGLDSNDTLLGTAGSDTLTAGVGNDTLDGGQGADTMTGGAGDDLYYVDNYSDVIAEGPGGGFDTVVLSATYYELGANIQVERIEAAAGTATIGTYANDYVHTLIGNDGANYFQAGAGDDTIEGLGGNDTLFGNAGSDDIEGGDGDDYIAAGPGNDVVVGGAGNDEIYGAEGADTLRGDAGDDELMGGFGDDDIQGGDGNDTIEGDGFPNGVIDWGDDLLDGGAGNDLINGNAGNDTIYGGADDDDLRGGAGQDYVHGGDGHDVVIGYGEPGDDNEADTLLGGAGDDEITVGYGDSADGGTGYDTLFLNLFQGPAGVTADLSQLANNGAISIAGGLLQNIEFVSGMSLTQFDDVVIAGPNPAGGVGVWIDGWGGNDQLTGTANGDTLYGLDGNDTLDGMGGNDVLDGGNEDDRLTANSGHDTVRGGAGNDVLVLDWSDSTNDITSDQLAGWTSAGTSGLHSDGTGRSVAFNDIEFVEFTTGSGNDFLMVGAGIVRTGEGSDHILGWGGPLDLATGTGNDIFWSGEQADLYDAGDGIDWIRFEYLSTGVTVTLSAPGEGTSSDGDLFRNVEFVEGSTFNDVLNGSEGADILGGGAGNDQVFGNGGNDNLSGGVDDDILHGGAGDDLIFAETGNDTLFGDDGADLLDGGTGDDWMTGGTGNDVYVVDSAGDLVIETASGGYDTVRAGVNHTLAAEVERLRSLDPAGTTGLSLSGNALANEIDGDAGANVIDGRGGADIMSGLGGNDVYFVDDAGDVIFEQALGGYDTVFTSVSYTLGAQLERLVTVDPAGTAALSLTGNTRDNEITGNAGANLLDGGSGADLMSGAGGDDIYFVDNAGDIVSEGPGAGYDTVFAKVSYTISSRVERLVAFDPTSTAALDLTGSSVANEVSGNDGVNVIDGGAGADLMMGLGGNDIYFVDETGDQVVELAGAGYDTVLTSVSYTIGSNVERLVTIDPASIAALSLTGNASANEITGNAGANIIDGGAGADLMSGAAGDDIYFVDNVGDIVSEGPGAGYDTVFSTVSYTISSLVERLVAYDPNSTTALEFTGSNVANEISGNNGANVINGGAGADLMMGLGGDDVYWVDDIGDQVVELAGGGTDTVLVSRNYALGSNLERLAALDTASSEALSLTGNGLANEITGNADGNLIDGGAGADILAGNGGADAFVFSSALGGGNVDTVVDFEAGVDRLYLDGAVFAGLAGGTLAAGAFVVGSAAVDADDRIIYDQTTGALYFDADGNGAGAAIQFASLQGGLQILASDFTVI